MNGKPPRLSRREMLQRSSVTASALALPVSGPEVAAGSVFALAADADLPSGVRAVWDLAQAYSEKTPTRERVCLNGLWRWQPAREDADGVPADRWGFFKVPGAWPGITDYLQKDCQTVFAHPDWRGERLADVTTAWYQREVAIPAGWSGRSIALSAEVVNSLATVFIDGARVGEIRFPAGELPLGDACKPGSKHLLSIRVAALPLKAVMSTYTDTGAARDVRGQVARRGLCGDVWLTSAPAGPRIERTRIATSVRQGSIRVAAVLADLAPGRSYTLRVQVREAAPEGAAAFSGNGPEHSRQRVEGREPDPAGVAPAEVAPNRTGGRRAPREAHAGAIAREFVSPKFTAADLKGGEIAFRERWLPTRLWDLNTPGHQDTAHVSLVEAGGKVADVALPRRFGFREFVIQGRDFYLNGSRIYLSAIPIDNAGVGAAWSTYAGARETMARMKSFGINFVYTHNYGCEPGTHLLFDDILRAADDCGMLVALSQPHFSHYDWKAPNADAENGYARHAAFYVRTAEAHPSVVAYAMSHNATSYVEDMNPDMIDGIHAPRESWGENNAKLALRAEAIVKTMDPERIVYHHSSGNLSSMHTSNFYVNFTPVQELCDWFEHWATTGVKPVFLCEYGVPFSWDWAMYRGWYKGKREWGSAVVPWEFCLAEWDAQIFGDRAYAISDKEKANLRWEAAQFRAGRVWHRWDYPNQLGSGGFAERNPVFGEYITANWRAYRGWGVSAFSPWEHAMFWVLRPG
ncbi:MAG TPA: glycoside hydrolase family 2 TIM barrel-domain containing protein, partial [Chthonomonadaceae bacterium]|nr:glycoside hydrolase family 2 TIM barrel-domain containing protein [Chthonomonadaceae bacterium]